MRVNLPTRIPFTKALLFTLCLVLVELLEGTTPLYAALVFCYFMLSVLAFNVAGGFSRPSGAYIFFYAMLVAGVGTVYKAILGQAAQTHLYAPLTVMGTYVVTVGMLLIAAYITRKVVTTREGVAGVMHVPRIDFGTSALGCVVAVFLISNAAGFLPSAAGGILHGLYMINYFLPLSILLGTIHAIRSSNGRHSTSTFTVAVLLYSTYAGLLSFSKQGMFTPFVCYILGVTWTRFRLRQRHILLVVGFAVFAQYFMVPLANVGREEAVTYTQGERLAITTKYLLHPEHLREAYKQRMASYADLDIWYYGTSQGIFDRFTMLPNDSQLISYTVQGHYFGYLPLYIYIQNWIPHVLNPDKPDGSTVGGNRYAHELNQLAEADTTTGISYSSTAEAFHMDGWRAVVLVQLLVFLLVFISTDAVCGDLRSQPWGLLPMLLFAHVAPEELLAGPMNYVTLGNVATIFAIFVCGYITPVFGRLFQGRDRHAVWQNNVPALDTRLPSRA